MQSWRELDALLQWEELEVKRTGVALPSSFAAARAEVGLPRHGHVDGLRLHEQHCGTATVSLKESALILPGMRSSYEVYIASRSS
jgi:hypothetical protein